MGKITEWIQLRGVSWQARSVGKGFLALLFLILILLFMMMFTPDLSSRELIAKYAQSPSQFTEVNGLRIHFRDTGDRAAVPVVLLHGFGSSLHTWDEWAKVLEKTHRVVRLDLAGFGLTGATPEQDYSDRADVQRIFEFLNSLGIEKCILIGHSMGGRMAWNFSSQYPQRVIGLVLMAPDGFPMPGQRLGERPYDVGFMGELIQFILPKFLVKKSIEPAFYDAKKVDDALTQRYYDLLRAPSVRQAILQRMRQTINSDPTERLKKITSPTLLLWGKSDRMIPSENSQDYLRWIAHSRAIILPKSGHLLQEENPQVGLNCVLEFIHNELR